MREGDELIPRAERRRRAAERDPVLAKMPDVRPFHLSPRDFEPIDPNNKKFKSPVFLVDPMFTEDMKDEEMVVFRDNDWAGWKQPLVHSRFPFIRKEV